MKINEKNSNIVFIVFLFLLIAIFGIFLSGCTNTSPLTVTKNNNVPPVSNNVVPASNSVELSGNTNATQNLLKFSSVEELQNFLTQRSLSDGSSSGGVMYKGGVMRDAVGVNSLAVEESVSAPSASTGAGTAGATDFSGTNNQVSGVDEADFIKNDDRYIYMIAENKLVIVDALDAKNAKILSQTSIDEEFNSSSELSPMAKDIFLGNNEVVVFVDVNFKSYYFQKYDIKPQQTYKTRTEVLIYDVSDRSKPTLKNKYSVSGSFSDARMINNYIYFISQDGVDPIYLEQPMIIDGIDPLNVIRPDIYYFDNPDQNYQFNTITSINLADNAVVDSKTFMLGYSNTLMVSENSIYIAYQKHNYWCWGWRCGFNNVDDKKRFYDVVVPLLTGEIKTNVNNIISQDLTDDEKWSKISLKLSEFYNKLEKDETLQNQYLSMFDKISAALDEYDTKKALEDQKTTIHKINVKDGQITYGSKGEVDGRLLNQFSLDEYNGNLRVATTVDAWISNRRMNYNNVYVLGSDMGVVGTITDIAQNESIYSTRFMGDKLYVVTFRQIDPFFVIDLSNPTNPKILGQLKIPGYSSYLHPYDANHIIGVGKSVGDNQWGGQSPKGVKISLFDVSDFNNPKEVDSYDIGIEGTDSPVLHDHKAFLFSPTKKILVLPVTEITEKTKLSNSIYGYNTKVWHGAYVFKVSESGFDLIGKVKHSSTESEYYNWWDQASVLRSLYMDNNLYTVSNKYIKINDLANNLNELNTINLPYNDNYQRYWY